LMTYGITIDAMLELNSVNKKSATYMRLTVSFSLLPFFPRKLHALNPANNLDELQ